MRNVIALEGSEIHLGEICCLPLRPDVGLV